ncbi:Hydrogenase transcriptional regulatory protein hupR1 [Vibrio aerogenes CECT 7868]|uniref:Hydrogenase transcriptional regulatory protein hupR1 n=1 Tax=Vibrio aerogenes CECT 7868 TaxID=1216006 RepID=A0A1M6CA88_9VIBR|nr:HD domain-containing phosphohydrolase [Vibrio aerogenes]SHI57942.1 Hydrogenase transcriptional regulatory protein hupR1 [Vibrio aerogenes CECT 7868]
MEKTAGTVSQTTDKLTILLLDDESDILKALNRVLRMSYQVAAFTEGKEALEYMATHEVSIIISDMRMPEMDGAEFLEKAKALQPETIRILLTGYSDIQSTIKAINSGGIHTYISKPWDNENLKLTVEKAAEFFHLKHEKERLSKELEERNLQLEQMNEALEDSNAKLTDFNLKLEQKVEERTQALKGSNLRLEALLKSRNKTFRDILSMVTAIIEHRTGFPADHAERIANQAKAVAQRMHLSESDVGHVYLCGLMHQIGLIGAKDSEIEMTRVDPESQIPISPSANPVVGAKVVANIKRFEPLVDIIYHQDEHYDGSGRPDHLREEEIPVGARIIKVVKDYDFYVASPYNPRRMTTKSAQGYLKEQGGHMYDPEVVNIYLAMIQQPGQLEDGLELCIGLSEVRPGMIIKKDLYLPNGNLMLTAGNSISSALLSRLKSIERQTNMPIAVYIG